MMAIDSHSEDLIRLIKKQYDYNTPTITEHTNKQIRRLISRLQELKK